MRISEATPLNAQGSIMYKIHKGNDELISVSRNNVLTYGAADIMARLVGGDTRYTPAHIGFMYGDDPTATLLADPDTLPDNIKRRHTWDVVTGDTAEINGNIVVAPFVLNPKWEKSSGDATYAGNAITVAAFTGATLEYAFPTGGATYAGELGTLANIYFYQALLLNRQVIGSDVVYRPFARVTLRDPDTSVYNEKPAGFDLSLFWTITFN